MEWSCNHFQSQLSNKATGLYLYRGIPQREYDVNDFPVQRNIYVIPNWTKAIKWKNDDIARFGMDCKVRRWRWECI